MLHAWSHGDSRAFDQLVPLVESELRRMAHAYMSRERPDHTLQTTALVNEAYVRLIDASRVPWDDRAHFFGIAARLMRRVLVDYARTHGAFKRGGDVRHVPLDDAAVVTSAIDVDLVALDCALDKFASVDERKSRVVELRFFGGLSVEETADALRVSTDTIKRDWRVAKLWLLRELAGAGQ